jgi:hypothetical protein
VNQHVEDLLWSLLQNAAWAAVVVATGYLVYRARATRKAARTWDLPALVPFLGIRRRDTPAIVVATSEIVQTRPMTGIGQVRGIALLTPTIQQAYGEHVSSYRVLMSSECDLRDERLAEDLVTIGGPKTNVVTRDVLERLSLPAGYGIASDGGVDRICWDGADGRTKLPDASSQRRYALGLVVRCENPIHGRGVLTVIAGAAASASGTYGTEAAATALAAGRDLRPSWWRAVRGARRGYLALVAAEIIGTGDVARLLGAKVLDIREIPWRAGGDG